MKSYKKFILSMLLLMLSAFSITFAEDKMENEAEQMINAQEFYSEACTKLSTFISNTSPSYETQFYSNGYLHCFCSWNDQIILHTVQTPTPPNNVLTQVQLLVSHSDVSSQARSQIHATLESTLESFPHKSWKHQHDRGPIFDAISYRYTGSLPKEAQSTFRFIDMQRLILLPEEMIENSLSLSKFLEIYLPDLSVEEFESFRYSIYDDPWPEDIERLGRLYEEYDIVKDEMEINVKLWREKDRQDPLIIWFYIHSEDNISTYMDLFLSLPGVDPHLKQPLFYLLGENATWQDVLDQTPYIACNQWKMQFFTDNEGKPFAEITYVGNYYDKVLSN